VPVGTFTVRLAASLAACVLYLLVEWRYNRRARLEVLLNHLREKASVAARLASGVQRLQVRVVAEPGARVVLGTSVEQPSEISGTPDLTSEGFTVRSEDGRLFAIPAGARLRMKPLAGARRNVTETITKASGAIEQRYTFELGPDVPFELLAKVPVVSSDDGPFRTPPASVELAPFEAQYLAGSSLASFTEASEPLPPDRRRLWFWVVGVHAVLLLASLHDEEFQQLWGFGVVATVGLVALNWFTADSPEPLPSEVRELEELQRPKLPS